MGRGDGCAVQLDSVRHPSMLSRRHCRLLYRREGGGAGDGGGAGWQVEDLGSQNGTVLNGCKLRRSASVAALADGDTLVLGVAQGERASDARYEVVLRYD